MKDERLQMPVTSRTNTVPQQDEGRILCYLKNGHIDAYSFGILCDFVKNEYTNDSNGPNYTDGIWSWDSELIYHVEKYHYRISDEFLTHMKQHNWEVPSVEHIELLKKQAKKLTKKELKQGTEDAKKYYMLRAYYMGRKK